MMTIANIGVNENGQFVDGRICTGKIRLGEVFTVLFDDDGSATDVHCTITRIEAYRHTFDELTEGMTARVSIKGEGMDKLVIGKKLR